MTLYHGGIIIVRMGQLCCYGALQVLKATTGIAFRSLWQPTIAVTVKDAGWSCRMLHSSNKLFHEYPMISGISAQTLANSPPSAQLLADFALILPHPRQHPLSLKIRWLEIRCMQKFTNSWLKRHSESGNAKRSESNRTPTHLKVFRSWEDRD